MVGKTVKRTYCHEVNDEELKNDVWAKTYDKAYAIVVSGNTDKHARIEGFSNILKEYKEGLAP